MKLFRFLWRLLRLTGHLLVGLWLSLTLPRPAGRDGERLPDPEPLSRWSGRLLEILGIRLTCHGPPPRQATLIVANHLSWLDIPVISACSHAAFLSKESVRYWPLVGWFAKVAGTLFIRRGRGEVAQVAQAISRRLASGRQLAIFPEGRIGDGQRVQRFFPHLFDAAIEAGVPVTPVALRYRVDGKPDTLVIYTPDRSLLGILLRVLARKGSTAELFFLPPIPPQGRDRRALARAARKAIQEALGEADD